MSGKNNKKRIAIILSGCGGMDGSETHEAISLMIAIKNEGADYECFALNENQKYVINGNAKLGIKQQTNETRNMLFEAGRLNHGMVDDLKNLDVNAFDGLVFPGGYGTGTSLSNFINCNDDVCKRNFNYKVRDEIKNIICAFHSQQKPIFAGCLAHILVNGSLKGITIMMDEGKYTAEAVENNGNCYETKTAGEICIDEKNKIITAPFYMTPKVAIDVIFDESVKAIKALIKMCK